MSQRIAKLVQVTLHSEGDSIIINALGQTVSTGWTDPELIPWVYTDAPQDGIQDYDFVAERPQGESFIIPHYLAVAAPLGRPAGGYWGDRDLKGVRVHVTGGSVAADWTGKASPVKRLAW